MKTPTGRECKFFYGDYYRGRNFEECRALGNPDEARNWTSELCKTCPMPGILINNACPNMVLSADMSRVLFMRKRKISAYCVKAHGQVKDPNVGCELCHKD